MSSPADPRAQNPQPPDLAAFQAPYRVGIAVVIAAALLFRLYLIFKTQATEEDFYITLRYAWNLAHGAGLVYNPGEHVLGTTTPLYTLLLALLIRLHLDPVLGGKLLCMAAEALSCWLVWRLGEAMQRPAAGVCAALCLAVAPLNLIESVKGMESSLVACGCIGVWSLWVRKCEIGAWVCAALVTLLRIDGIALAAVLLAASLVRDRRVSAGGLALFGLLTVPWALYARTVFGSPVPTSLRAKLIVYGWHSHGLAPNLGPFLRVMLHNPLGAALALGAVLAAVTVARRPRSRDAVIVAPMIAWLLLYYGGMAFSRVFLFGWYFLPPTPVYYFIGCAGLCALPWRRWLPERLLSSRAVRLAAPWIVLAMSAPIVLPRAVRSLVESQSVETELRIPIGQWLHRHAAPGDTVMLEPIGYIGWYSGLRVLDTVGLVSPEALPLYRESEPSPYHAMWQRFHPEWILLRTGELEDLRRAESALRPGQRLEARYELAAAWRSPGSRPDSAPAFTLFHRKGGR